MLWILSNYNRDKEEELEKVKIICTFIDPQGAKKFFDNSEDVITEFESDAFLKEIQSQSNEKFTPDDLRERLRSSQDYDGVDIIEHVGD